ncbi:hypothetical protein LEMLEM_LOCUS8850 [Lemmus lemmus]
MKSASQHKPSASGFQTHCICEKQPFTVAGCVPGKVRGCTEDA